MKLGQLIDYRLVNYRITRGLFFFKNYAEIEAGRLVPDIFLFFEDV